MKAHVHLRKFLSEFFVEWELYAIKDVEQIKTSFYAQWIFFRKIVPFVR
jgi:hypothetical protein